VQVQHRGASAAKPWTPLTGEFWNAPFGALRYADVLPDAAAVVAFFAEGRRLAA
jgi:hypothetical protein